MVLERGIAVVGAGLIGRAWAIAFARGGCAVRLYDAQEGAAEAALATIEGLLADLEAQQVLGGADASTVRARIAALGSLEAAVEGAELVQENTPENLEVKRRVTAEIAAAAGPDTAIVSSTSSFVPSLFTEHVPGRERCFVGHPINPPYLVPAVELVPAPWSDQALMDRASALYEAVGMAPIRMQKELEAFIVNRLQTALLHEAFRLLEGGYARSADVDRAIAQGLGLRWSFMGPFETIDLNAPAGVRDYLERYTGIFERLAPDFATGADFNKVLEQGLETEREAALPREALAERQRWRDRRLMALARHKAEADRDIGK